MKKVLSYLFLLLVVQLEVILILCILWFIFGGKEDALTNLVTLFGSVITGIVTLLAVFLGIELQKRRDAEAEYPMRVRSANKILSWSRNAHIGANGLIRYIERGKGLVNKQWVEERFSKVIMDGEAMLDNAVIVGSKFFNATNSIIDASENIINLVNSIHSDEENSNYYSKKYAYEEVAIIKESCGILKTEISKLSKHK